MRSSTLLFLALLSETAASAQAVLGSSVNLLPSDVAVLESREARKDLRCAVKATPPELGFDFTYHAGFAVTIPLRELTGEGDLTSLFRVTPAGGSPRDVVHFTQKWRVPPIEEDAKGEVDLHGAFTLGEGTYHVSWMMRDRAERFCSAQWQITVDRRGKERMVQLRMPPGAVGAADADLFAPEPAVDRAAGRPLHVLVFLHYAPRAPGAATLRRDEAGALLAMLRSVAREPGIGRCSLIAFNLAGGQTLFRQKRAETIDFPALGDAVEKLDLGTVTVDRLAQGATGADFLSALLADEIAEGAPDALIFIGPKMITESFGLDRSLRTLGNLGVPTFYLNYDSHPNINPWRDVIGTAVRAWRGFEHTITRPRDLTAAWASVMAHLTEGNSPTGLRKSPAASNGIFPKK